MPKSTPALPSEYNQCLQLLKKQERKLFALKRAFNNELDFYNKIGERAKQLKFLQA